jgi:hypothetical protein
VTSRLPRLSAACLVAGGVGWATLSAVIWLRYGHGKRTGAHRGDPLDAFIPDPEVDERHETRVRAPAAVTWQVAKELDLQRSPLVWLIFSLRTFPARLRGQTVRWETPGLVEETLGIGWGVLKHMPDELYVSGAVTQPWEADVEFRALPAEEFAGFNDPGYAKIVWTLEADALSERESVFRTRTRVRTTNQFARRRFRLYWAILSPGILLIRYEALRLVRREARRRAAMNP